MQPGQTVKIYEDPITCRKLEGKAVLILKNNAEFHELEYWRVKFLNGDIRNRFISTRDPEEQRMEAEDVKLEIRPLSERNHPMV